MSETRKVILGRVRAALSNGGDGGGAERSRPEPPPVPRDYRTVGDLDPSAIADLFAERVAEYGADVLRTGPEGHAAAIGAAAAAHDADRLGVPPGLPAAWRPREIEAVPDEGLAIAELDALDGALTGCAAAIAETGTILLDGGERSGRRALTLIPDLHVCVVEEGQVAQLVPEGLTRLDPTAPITLVSGPSATSDIGFERVDGVHGPRRLVVILLSAVPDARPLGA